MKNYHDLLANVMDNGEDQFNTRTGKTCRALVGAQLQYDLAEGFPAITTKKLAFNNMKGELLGFFRGYDNAADFRALGCTVWDDNANKTPAWLANPARKGTDDLGRGYGKQWVDWKDRRLVRGYPEARRLSELGYSQVMYHYVDDADGKVLGRISQEEYLMERSINQLEGALEKLMTDPSDRRIIVSAWNPAELDLTALVPCHMDYRFVAFENPKKLHVVMTIRSWDLGLGAPFNIASTALFLSIMARLSGYEPGTVTIQAANAHIYPEHRAAIEEQLTRSHFESPRLVLSDVILPISGLGDIPGVFERIQPEDIWLEGYQSHGSLPMPMAV